MGDRLQLPALLETAGGLSHVPLADARRMLRGLRGKSVGLDCETSGVEPGLPGYQLRTVQVGNEQAALVLDAQNPMHLAVAADVLDRAGEIVAHSATADVSLLARELGRDPHEWWDKVTDTMVLAGLQPATAVGTGLSLEDLSARLLDTPFKPRTAAARKALFQSNGWLTNTGPATPLERNGWAQVPIDHPTMVEYAAADVIDTAALRRVLPDPGQEVAARERRLHGLLARVSERGLRLDPTRIYELEDHHRAHMDRVVDRLRADYGLDNPASNAEAAAVLGSLGAADLPLTAGGAVSVAKPALDSVVSAGGLAADFARLLLEYRSHSKLLGTYISMLAQHTCEGADGRVYPTIHQMGARATGRMSAARPNIQNWPRPNEVEGSTTGGLRGTVISDPGTLLISADFSSVEVRLAAAVAGDTTLIRMIEEGLDLHGAVVEQVWGLKEGDTGFKDARYAAKRAVFGYLYGAGLRRMSMQLGEHGDRAQDVVDALRSITPQLFHFNNSLREAVRDGQMCYWTHPSGRVAYFDRQAPYKALNTVVQGWGREVLVDALLAWEDRHPGCLLWPIHDELVVQVPEEHAQDWTRDLVDCMTMRVGSEGAEVDIVCEADAPTDRWGVSKPFD